MLSGIKRLRIFSGFDRSGLLSPVMILFFLGLPAGAAAGCFFSDASSVNFVCENMAACREPSSFTGVIFSVFLFMAAALLLSTSYLGIILVPALGFVRAYCFSASIAVFYVSYGASGLLYALFAVGLPALFFLPAFFLCAGFAASSAGGLYALRFASRTFTTERWSARQLALAAALALIASLYDFFILPLILTGFF